MTTLKELFSGLPLISGQHSSAQEDTRMEGSGLINTTLSDDAGLIPVNGLTPQELNEASEFLYKTSGTISQLREPIDFPNLAELKRIGPSPLRAQGNEIDFDGSYCSSDGSDSTMGFDYTGTNGTEIAYAGDSGSAQEDKKQSTGNFKRDLDGFMNNHHDLDSVKPQSPSFLQQSWDLEKFAQQHHSSIGSCFSRYF